MRFRVASVIAIGVVASMATALARVPQGRGVAVPQVTPSPQTGQTQTGSPPPPLVTTGLIVGRVVDAATGQPVAGVTVSLGGGPSRPPLPAPPTGRAGTPPAPLPQPAQAPRVLTDAEGRFAFRSLTRGNYNITTSKTGYLSGAYGRNRPEGPSKTLQLDDNEKVADLVVRVFKYASITGRITDEAGEPIVNGVVKGYRRALVAGRWTFREVNQVQTDDRGIYRLGSLTPGDYTVAAPMSSITTPGTRMGASAEQNYSGTVNGLNMAPGAAGSGRQIGADGRFVIQSDNTAITVDASGRWRGYATQYFPAARSITQGELITLGSGTDRSGIDIQMTYVPVNTISGILTTPVGTPANYALRLVSSDQMNIASDPEAATTMTDSTGAFVFYGIPSGQYTIQVVRVSRQQGAPAEFFFFNQGSLGAGTPQAVSANPTGRGQAQPPPDPMLWASVPLSVGDADVNGVVVAMQEGFTISGRFEFTGTRPKPDAQRLSQIPVTIEPADGRENFAQQGGPPSRSAADGRFITSARPPGKYLLRIGGAPAGFIAQSITVNGINVTDVPFDLTGNTNAVVTFTDQIASVTGTVRGLNPGDDMPLIVLFPTDTRAWKEFGFNPQRIKSTRPSATGTFSFGSMVGGDYLATAIADEFSADWQDPAFLELLARSAERFTLIAGQKQTVSVDIQRIKPPGIGRDALLDDSPGSQTTCPGCNGELPQQVRDTRGADPVGTSSISGTVTIDDGGLKPARMARVRVAAQGVSERYALTDDAGRYTIAWLPPGDYQVQVTKPAYLPMYFGAKRPVLGPGATVRVDAGKQVANINITMSKGAVISGTVFDETGLPVPGVRMQLQTFIRREGERGLTNAQAPGGGSSSVSTNDRGEFRFYGLRSGSYVVIAQPPSSSINQELRQLSDSEVRAAMAEASKSPVPKSVLDTVRTILPAPTPDLPASPQPGRVISYSPVFYPGTTRAEDASELALATGQELNNINVQVRLVPASRLDGRVIGPDGQPAMNTQVILLRFTGSGMSTSSLRVQNGFFTGTGVPAGRYVLTAQMETPAGRGNSTPPGFFFAQMDLDLNGDDRANLILTLAPLPTVSGRVVFEGEPPANLNNVQVRLEPVGQFAMQSIREVRPATADANGMFTLTGVMPGRYRMNASVSFRNNQPPSPGQPGNQNQPGAIPMANATGWSVASATVSGQDAWVLPFQMHYGSPITDAELRLTNRPADLSGKLIDSSDKPVPNYTVVLFPADKALWISNSSRVNRTTRSSPTGTFSFPLTVPGEYYLAVLTELDTADWPEVDFKEQIVPSAIKITIGKGEKKVQDMKIGR